MKRKYIPLFCILITFASCERFAFSGFLPFGNSNVNSRFAESIALESAKKTISVSDSSYRFYCCADVHYAGSANKMIDMINQSEKDSMSVMALVLGDITDYNGGLPEVRNIIDNMNLQKHFFTAVGNHDLYFKQWNDYVKHFGAGTYTLTVKGPDFSDLFICIDTGTGIIGNKQKNWLEETLKENKNKHRHTIILTHTNVWDTDNTQIPSGNMNIEDGLILAKLCDDYNVKLYICGHDHSKEEVTFKGTTFVTMDDLKDESNHSSFLIVDMKNECVSYKFNEIN